MGSPTLIAALRHAWVRSLGSLSLAFVFLCVSVFILTAVLDLFDLVSREQFVRFFGLSYLGLIRRGWVHQVVTAWLVHTNVMHLLFNMLSLWMLGPSVEAAIGRRRYVFLILVSVGSAALGTLVLTWGTGTIVAGCTSVVFAVLVAQALLFPNNIVVIFYFFPMKMKPAAVLLIALALYFAICADPGGAVHAVQLFAAVGAFFFLGRYRCLGSVRRLQSTWLALKKRLKSRKRRRPDRTRRTETPWKL